MNSLPTYFVRRPSGLYALRLELTEQGLPEIPINYVVRRRRLTRSIAAAVPGGEVVRRAWSRLARATNSESTLDALNTVLRNCAPVSCHHVDPAPQLHSSHAIDIQPWLTDPTAVADFIEQLTGSRPKDDPYFAWNHSSGVPELSGRIREHVLPLTPKVGRWSLQWIDDLVRDSPEIFDRLLVLLALTKPEHTFGWVALLLCHRSEYVTEDLFLILEKVFRTRAFEKAAPNYFQEKWAIFEENHNHLFRLLLTLFEVVAEGGDPDYFADGLELETRYKFEHKPEYWKSRACKRPEIGAPINTIRSIGDRENDRWLAIELMDLCSELEDLKRFIWMVDASLLDSEKRLQLLKWPGNFREEECWPRALTESPLILECLHREIADGYAEKFLKLVAGVVRHDVDGFLEACLPVISRICQPPFEKHCLDGHVCCILRSFQRKRCLYLLEKAPHAEMRRFHEACYDQNTVWGLQRLAAVSPFLVKRGLRHCSKRLFQVAEIVGSFNQANWLRVCEVWKEHPLMSLPITSMPLENLVILLESLWRDDGPNPIAKTVRQHVSNIKPLDPRRADHYRSELNDFAARYAFRELQQLLERALITSKAELDLDSYSLLIAAEAEKNKRPLRRFFRAWKWSDAKPDDHPLNSRWLESRFTKKKRTIWARGIPRCLENLEFSVEQDPEEILRMGGYVDSCLAVGGPFSWSAPANLLDANKRVIFARREDGKFAGRQLVVVSDEGELIYFDVYPCDLPKRIVKAFATYDLEFAKELNLPLWDQKGDYKVQTLVANDWYEDCLFNPMKILKQDE